jgi:hypothetical protein
MNMLFFAASPDLYLHFTNKAYPSSYFPFPKEVDDIPDFSACMTKDCKANWQRMTTTWYPSEGFKPLATRLYIGASYASAARYPMDNREVINIGLRIIKHCGMYAKEHKNWILCKNSVPPIVKTINSFKEYWADTIALVNQTAVPALQDGYGMTAVDYDALVTLYIVNFSAVYAALQETMKSQAYNLVAMQNQLANIQQLCMAICQQ